MVKGTRDLQFTIKEKYVSTGEAAILCSVARDTVLRWINTSRVPARQTAGGHHRIAVSDLRPFIVSEQAAKAAECVEPFCWEFHSQAGAVAERCTSCIVYRSRAHLCYEMAQLPTDAGHSRTYCVSDCKDCEYYRMIKRGCA